MAIKEIVHLQFTLPQSHFPVAETHEGLKHVTLYLITSMECELQVSVPYEFLPLVNISVQIN